ncbi:MAG: HVO_0649 family zinc finger protein [Haloferacaceae archaeon]
MSVQRPLGNSALNRLGSYLDEVERTCSACGYHDAEGRWEARATGNRVIYRHECPSCGATVTRTLDLRQ